MDLFLLSIFLRKIYDTAKQTLITIETEPHVCIEIEHHSTFAMVNIVSSMVCVHLHQVITTSHNMAAILMMILQLTPIHAALV